MLSAAGRRRRETCVSFAVPDRAELTAVIVDEDDQAGSLWAAHRRLD